MDEETKLRLGDLIIDLAKGNSDALQGIYDLMGRVLYAIGNTYFYSREDVKDAVHNFLLSLYEKSKSFKSNRNAYAWIIRLYVNSLLNIKKRNKTEERILKDYAEKMKRDDQPFDEYLSRYLYTQEVMGKLTSYERKLVFSRFYCGFSLEEIAKDFHKPKSTIQYQIDKIEEKLQNFKNS